jgi:hypothetical protein
LQGTQGTQGIQGTDGLTFAPVSGTGNPVATNLSVGTTNTDFFYYAGTSSAFTNGTGMYVQFRDTTVGSTLTYVGNFGSVFAGGFGYAYRLTTITEVHGTPVAGTSTDWQLTEIGYQGAQGTQGITGSQGTNGTNGVQGTTGTQGTQGLEGLQGVTGSQGTDGVNGVQGTTGTQGLNGIQGIEGLQGITGTQGTQGLEGIQGTTGSQGLDGIQGITGTQGITGSQGTTGAEGIQGVQGTDGIQGATGTQGATGSQGTQGTQGVQGTTGLQGLTGTQGLQGTLGTQGTTGTLPTITFNAQSTAYQLVAGDVNKWVTQSGTANITVPSGTFSTGQVIYVQRIGAGAVSIVASGVTFTSNGSASPVLRAQYSSASILCTSSNNFTIVGDIS